MAIGRLGVACAMAGIALPAAAGVAEYPAEAHLQMKNPSLAALVVRIDQTPVEEEGSKSAEGRLTVVEVLRGKSFEPGAYRYRLYPREPPWPGDPEKAGEEYIVFTASSQPAAGTTIILADPLIRSTPENRRKVEAKLVRNSPLLPPLFFVVLLAPLLGFIKRYGWLSVAVGWGGYVVYEMLMSPVYNIRVDLLILFPALGASLVIPLVMSFLWRRVDARIAEGRDRPGG